MRSALNWMVPASVVFAFSASAATLVPGDSNPNLAGRANGYSCCSGDSVPGQSPVEVTEVEVQDCGVLLFSVFGRVSVDGSVPLGNNGDGDNFFSMTNYGDGISAPTTIRDNALVGVFLDDTSPTGDPTPPQLTFEDAPDFLELYPRLNQIFFIGDGQTTDSKAGPTPGTVQEFRVPNGGTRFFLGTTDGFGWANNGGTFTVNIQHVPSRTPAVAAMRSRPKASSHRMPCMR
jgi:hypothetical protein